MDRNKLLNRLLEEYVITKLADSAPTNNSILNPNQSEEFAHKVFEKLLDELNIDQLINEIDV